MDSRFIPLGSGEVLPWETHPSLTVLHQLKLFNFPVPNGIVLINLPFSDAGLCSKILEDLEDEIKQRELKTNLSLIAFTYDEKGSMVNRSCTLESLQTTFADVFFHLSASQKTDFLILEDLPGLAKGKAFSQWGYLDDWIEFQLSSAMPVTRMPIEKLSPGEAKIRGDFRGRLQELLRSMRKALGEDNWILGWTDNSEAIFITSVEKISSPLFIEDAYLDFTDWEILQERPNNLQGSLISFSSPKLFQYFKHWAPELSEDRPFVLWRESKIEFNVSLLGDFLRVFGLSNRPLKDLFALFSFSATPLNSIRFWRTLPRFLRFIHDLNLGPGIANRTSKKLSSFETSPEKPFSELFQEWQNIFIASSHSLYRLTLLSLLAYYPQRLFNLPQSLQRKAKEAEANLRTATQKALMNIHQALQVKALGWYSRGLLPNDEAIWSLTREQILAIENELE